MSAANPKRRRRGHHYTQRRLGSGRLSSPAAPSAPIPFIKRLMAVLALPFSAFR